MEHLQAIEPPGRLKLIHRQDELTGCEPKDRAVAPALAPLATHLAAELDAHANARLDLQLVGHRQHDVQLLERFEHQHRLQAHLERGERQARKLFILIAIADNVGFRIVHIRQRRNEFGLRAGFQTVVVGPAKGDHVLHRLLLLVDLDGVNAPIDAAVLVVGNRLGKGFVDDLDARGEDVAKA